MMQLKLFQSFVLSSILSTLSASSSQNSATLSTTLGQLSGIRQNVYSHKYVDVFWGIPFAEPPVGERRFSRPVPAVPWQETRDATTKPTSCWQAVDTMFDRFPGVDMWNPHTPMDEDCLYLNVWRPVSRSSLPKPIMVWIYGGGFYSGSTTLDIYDGSQLADQWDVIVISISYRVGPWGFLYLGTNDAPGNAGLLDQTMALKWVKDNAANLGGSPDDITIFGESAGAASVGYHLLSPLSRDLFTYAIMESASPLSGWAFETRTEATSRSKKLAEIFNCSTASNDAITQCLQSVKPQDLADGQWILPSYYMDATQTAVVDGYFLPDAPLKMLRRGDIKNTSIIMGVNKDEGIYFDVYGFPDYFPLDGDGELTKEQYDKIILQIAKNDTQLVQEINELYMSGNNLSYTDIIDDVSGDQRFKCPVVDFAQLYAELGNPVYIYSFEHRISTNPWPQWLGVAHGYEIEIFFGLPLASDSVYTKEETALSWEVTRLLTHFAKTGNPNGYRANVWPRYTPSSSEYVVIDTNGVRVESGLRATECAFWNIKNWFEQPGPAEEGLSI